MWRIVQHSEPDDFVVGTGDVHSLEEFVEVAFAHAGLDWRTYVRVNEALLRPNDLEITVANPRKAREELGWSATVPFAELVLRLYRDEL
jgi:GDPmannose 4,6-dehydratase